MVWYLHEVRTLAPVDLMPWKKNKNDGSALAMHMHSDRKFSGTANPKQNLHLIHTSYYYLAHLATQPTQVKNPIG